MAQHTAARLQTATILHPGKHQALKLEVAEPVRAKVAEQALGDKPQQAQARSASASSKAPLALWGVITGAWLLLISGLFEEQLGTPGLV
ncbi:MAG: hypothetical protein RLY65_167, partial [Pseudomonadota bacterium]